MRWKNEQKPSPGDVKYEKVFAWLPVEIEGHTVWLEFYGVSMMYLDTIDTIGWFTMSKKLL